MNNMEKKIVDEKLSDISMAMRELLCKYPEIGCEVSFDVINDSIMSIAKVIGLE